MPHGLPIYRVQSVTAPPGMMQIDPADPAKEKKGPAKSPSKETQRTQKTQFVDPVI